MKYSNTIRYMSELYIGYVVAAIKKIVHTRGLK